MNPAIEAIKGITKNVVSQYTFPVWGKIVGFKGRHSIAANSFIVDVEIVDPAQGVKMRLNDVPVLANSMGKGMSGIDIELGDYVKVVFEGGDKQQPAVVALLDQQKFSNDAAIFPMLMGEI